VQDSYVLEIAVDTLDRALAAERGGAHRIELCRELSRGGLTPSVESMRLAREQVRLPIFAMIRPRAGDFAYSEAEFAEMQRDVTVAARMGMNGVVLGMLSDGGRIDIDRTRQLVELARPLPVTFHRAFDVSADLHRSLEDVIRTGTVRILTSGGAECACRSWLPGKFSRDCFHAHCCHARRGNYRDERGADCEDNRRARIPRWAEFCKYT